MKPSWDQAPSWAQWLAMDADGDWWWYEHEPEPGPNIWINKEKHADGHVDPARRANDKNWKRSKEPRP